MWRLAWLLFLLAAALAAQFGSANSGLSVPDNGAILSSRVIADLPATASTGTQALITDGANHADCATGSGSDLVICAYNSGWSSISARNSFGAFHSSTGTTNNTSGTPLKIAGAHTLSGLEVEFDEPVDGRMRYIGSETHTFKFTIHFSFTSDSNNTNILLAGAKNGTVIDDSEQERRISTGADLGALSTAFIVSLATNDYIECFLDSSTGNPAITTAHLQLILEVMDR